MCNLYWIVYINIFKQHKHLIFIYFQSHVVERAGGARRDETTLLAGAAVAAILAFLLFCRARLRQALM